MILYKKFATKIFQGIFRGIGFGKTRFAKLNWLERIELCVVYLTVSDVCSN